MLLQPFDVVVYIWLAIAVLSAGYVAVDQFRNNGGAGTDLIWLAAKQLCGHTLVAVKPGDDGVRVEEIHHQKTGGSLLPP